MPGYQQAYANLNDAQKQAVDHTDGPVLVIAGPGTGKTQLLTTRIAHILATADARPDNILCLTFTDAAAANMRDRLTSMIGKDSYTVSISTYHAFGSDVLQRYPEYFADFADLSAADALRIDQVLRQAQASMPYSNPLKHEIFVADLKGLISDFKRALLHPDDVRKIAKANQSFITAANVQVGQCLGGMAKMSQASIPHFAELLTLSNTLPASQGMPVIPLQTLWRESLAEAVDQALITGKTKSLTDWKNRWLAKDGTGQFIAAGADISRKQLAAADIYETYLQLLRTQHLYDYDDMIVEAVHGLEANPDLRYSLQERYQYLLLDEFQDTNSAQLRLVQLLTDNPVNEGRPNVLAVGDDDQAIYAFQGAHYSHMLEFYRQYRDVLVVPLTENYRSQAEILSLAEGISGQISERLHHNFPGISKQLTAASTTQAPTVVGRYEFLSDLTENSWVASKITALQEQGIEPSQIAVLAPKHKYLEALLPFLHAKNLPIRYDKREDVLADPAMSELLLMSRLVLALATQNTAVANQLWPQVLSLVYFSLPTSLIWQLSWSVGRDGNWTEQLCAEEQTKLTALFFIRLSLQAGRDRLETSLDYLVGSSQLDLQEPGTEPYRSPFYSHYFGDSTPTAEQPVSFWHVLSNLTVLRGRLRGYRSEADKSLTLADFVAFAGAHHAANIKILNTNPYQEADNAVTLMTAHKAKGQEFEVVFVLAADDEVWGSRSRTQSSRIALPENIKFIRHAGATEDERLRLFFVAISRAKTQLYITNSVSDFTGKKQFRLKYLDERVADDGAVTSPLLPSAGQTVIQSDVTAPPLLQDLDVYWREQRHIDGQHDPKLRELLQDRLQNYQLSISGINRFTDTTINGPTSLLLRDLLRFPTGSSLSGTYGDVIHSSLHWLQTQLKATGQVPTLQAAVNRLSTLIHDAYLDEQDSAQLIERGTTCLQAYLEQRANLLRASDVSEYNFRQEGVFVGEAHLSGAIDRLVLDPETKTATVVDFKTGRSHDRWSADLRMHHYRQQLYFYKLLVENSTAFHDYVVTDAYLEFVEPNEAGNITELHVSFDRQVMNDFKKLIGSVWQHVTELNFPDVSKYDETFKGSIAFQHDLINDDI